MTENAPQSIRQQAADWLARRHSGAWSARDQRDLQHWLRQNPQHRQVFDRLSALWGDLDDMKPEVAALRGAARRYRPPRTGLRRLAAPALAAGLLLSAGFTQWYWIGSETAYRTAIGEQRHVDLADGSTLLLNADTELRVRYSGRRRRVDLVRGEALFTVAHAAQRPFEVRAGAGNIRDVGTRFDVDIQADKVAVGVLEGEVEISTPGVPRRMNLTTGQAFAYDARGETVAGYHGDVQAATAWREGWLLFRDMPLPEVATLLSRHHPVRFELTDRRLADIRISGSFRADNLAVLLKTLQAGFPIAVVRVDPQHIRLHWKPR